MKVCNYGHKNYSKKTQNQSNENCRAEKKLAKHLKNTSSSKQILYIKKNLF